LAEILLKLKNIVYNETTSRIGNRPRRRPEFESDITHAESAKLKKVSGAGGF
jgi:hypothetical protein